MYSQIYCLPSSTLKYNLFNPSHLNKLLSSGGANVNTHFRVHSSIKWIIEPYRWDLIHESDLSHYLYRACICLHSTGPKTTAVMLNSKQLADASHRNKWKASTAEPRLWSCLETDIDTGKGFPRSVLHHSNRPQDSQALCEWCEKCFDSNSKTCFICPNLLKPLHISPDNFTAHQR